MTVNVGCPCTLVGPTSRPTSLDQGDTNAVELGMRFKADLDGSDHRRPLLQVRRRTPARTSATCGPRAGRCSPRGTFSGESASGWQQLTFATPVDITAGTTYVASYFAPRGHYSSSPASSSSPARAAATRSTARRCTRSAPTAASPTASTPTRARATFPTSTFNGENYAVDVVFVPKLPPGPAGAVRRRRAPARPRSTSPRRPRAARRRATSSRRSSARRRRRRRPSQGSPPATSVRVSGLDPGTSYTFKVQAANGSGSESVLGRVERGHADRRRPRRARRPGSAPAATTARRRSAGPRPTTAAPRSPATRSRRTWAASRSPRPR